MLGITAEMIGGVNMPLRIGFVTHEEFGLSRNVMRENDIPLIVCGHVGAFKGLVWHTEMAQFLSRQKTDCARYCLSCIRNMGISYDTPTNTLRTYN